MEIKSIKKVEEVFKVEAKFAAVKEPLTIWATRKFDPELSCSVVYEVGGSYTSGNEVEPEIEEAVIEAINKL